MTDLPAPDIVRTSRGKALRAAAITLIVPIVLFLFKDPDSAPPLSTDVAGGIFVVMALVLAVRAAFPQRLVIDDGGVAWKGYRSWRIAWSEVEQFRLTRLRRTTIILIDYLQGSDLKSKWRRPRQIPSFLERDPKSLQETLQARLVSARAAAPGSPSVVAPAIAIPVAEPRRVIPWVSLGITLVLAACFAAEVYWPVDPGSDTSTPSIHTLVAFGGIDRAMVIANGEFYRFVTAPLLHANPSHIALNVYALLLAGWLLEGVTGRLWYAAIFVVGALGGDLLSITLNPDRLVGVGASGAIMGLFAATLVCSLHFRRSGPRDILQRRALFILLPTLAALTGTAGDRIDFGAHLGGTIAGGLMGALLLWLWRDGEEKPGGRAIAGGILATAAVAMTASAYPAYEGYESASHLALLAPDSFIPSDDKALTERALVMTDRYPHDPRLLYGLALDRLARNDNAGAEVQLRKALAEAEPMRSDLTPQLFAALRITLAQALVLQSKNEDAIEEADKGLALAPDFGAGYFYRASAELGLRQFDKAKADVDRYAAVKDVNTALAADLAAKILYGEGDAKGAAARFSDVLTAKPNYASAYMDRGLARYYSGDYPGAISDFDQLAHIIPTNLYAPMWAELAFERSGGTPAVAAPPVDPSGEWPTPVLRAFHGEIDKGAVMAAAKADPAQAKDRVCEADFYLAARGIALKQGGADTMAAIIAECPPNFIETEAARYEQRIAGKN